MVVVKQFSQDSNWPTTLLMLSDVLDFKPYILSPIKEALKVFGVKCMPGCFAEHRSHSESQHAGLR